MRKYLLTIMTMFFVCCSSDGGMQAETLQTGNDMTMYITIAGQTQSIKTGNDMTMYITIAGQTQSITLANNAATQELVERLQNVYYHRRTDSEHNPCQ